MIKELSDITKIARDTAFFSRSRALSQKIFPPLRFSTITNVTCRNGTETKLYEVELQQNNHLKQLKNTKNRNYE